MIRSTDPTLRAEALAQIIDLAADAIVSIDEAQRIVLFNQGAEGIFGYRADEVLGQPLTLLLPESVRARHPEQVARFEESGRAARYMNQRSAIVGRRRNGELFPAEATISRVGAPGERLYTAVLRDISERRTREAELSRSRQHLEAILGSVDEGVIGIDRAGLATFVNAAACRLLGYRADELIGRELHALVHHSHADGAPYPKQECPAWRAAHQGAAAHRDHELYWRADGSPLPVEYTATPYRVDGEIEGAVIVFRDATRRRQAEEELRAQSMLDELTGLHNRRGFLARAGDALRQAQHAGRHSVLLFTDLDEFKAINDTHGHHAGDRALRAAAQVLREVFRESDVVARYGGDEFVVLACEGAEPHAPDTLRARVQAAVESCNRRGDAGVPISMSIGTATFDPRAPRPLEQLMRDADAGLYAHKRARRAGR
jgi:diguanylate cyclase (GGDEF)-like protein/PAS domain S-box-containing protein